MSEKHPIEITVHLSEADFWRVSFASRIKRFFFVTAIYLPIALVIIYFVAFGAGADPFSGKGWSPLIAFFIICAIPFVFLPSVYFSLRKLAKKLANAAEETHFAFSENEIEAKSLSRSSKLTWKNCEKIQETKEDFIFYLTSYTFLPIPKRFFKNSEQLNEFKELVRTQLGEKAKLRND